VRRERWEGEERDGKEKGEREMKIETKHRVESPSSAGRHYHQQADLVTSRSAPLLVTSGPRVQQELASSSSSGGRAKRFQPAKGCASAVCISSVKLNTGNERRKHLQSGRTLCLWKGPLANWLFHHSFGGWLMAVPSGAENTLLRRRTRQPRSEETGPRCTAVPPGTHCWMQEFVSRADVRGRSQRPSEASPPDRPCCRHRWQ
jgi:hypothetical protein